MCSIMQLFLLATESGKQESSNYRMEKREKEEN